MLYAIVGMLVIILDQGVKYWVTNNIMVNTVTEPLIPGVLSLVRLHNDGAAFSFLAGGGARIYFIILTAVFTIAVIVALATNFISGKFGRWCLVLVTAGGLSNCLDRILYGFVVDMFKIELFDFAVFNVADIFITVFCLLFIIYIIFGGEKEKPVYDEFDEVDDEGKDRSSLRGNLKESMAADKKEKLSRRIKNSEKQGRSKRAEKYDYSDGEETASPRFGRKRKAAVTEEPEKKRRAPRERQDTEGEKPAVRMGRPKKTRYEEDYEEFKASRGSGEQRRPASVRKAAAAPVKSVPEFDANDPFAAWEKANAKVESRHSNSSTARAMGVNKSADPWQEFSADAPADDPFADFGLKTPASPAKPAARKFREPDIPASPAKPAARKFREPDIPAAAAKPAAREFREPDIPASPAKPAAREFREPDIPVAPKPERKPDDMGDFTLDDILNEFK
ncbi:MAG: signal peptidase II [Candidatus Limivicinus sp.]|jgi:signal peptidase II